ncbi:MAG: hypothetical protein ABJB86_16830 [Bacteroidota bacterium]
MLEVVENYMLLKKQITQLIRKSGYRNDYIAAKIGMRTDYFAVKKQRGNWSDLEVAKIIKVIDNEEVTKYFDSLLIKNSFPGDTVTSIEFEKIMGW